MIEELVVHNYALVDSLRIEFGGGLTVLTGETGAGKSLLVGALSLIRGAKAEVTAIREGKREATVSATIRVAGHEGAERLLGELGVETEDGCVLVRRTVKRTGRGSIYIENTPVTRAQLVEFSALVFDIHSQHEHQSLLSEDAHRDLLDRFCGAEPARLNVATLFSEASAARREFSRMREQERRRLQDRDLLEHALDEINTAEVRPGEYQELTEERTRLNRHERIVETVEDAYGAMVDREGGAVALIRAARSAMDTLVELDPRLAQQARRLDDVYYELEDIVSEVRSYRGDLTFDPARLDFVEGRLRELERLLRKYGETEEEILAYRDDAQRRLERLDHWEEDEAALREKVARLDEQLRDASDELTAVRKRGADDLSGRLQTALRELGMPRAEFHVLVEPRRNDEGKRVYSTTGSDRVAFEITANQGERARPLSRVASGGELSRVMLSVKATLSDVDMMPTLVFDEVDTGIGGQIARAVGRRLQLLAETKQVICVTHLASVAAHAAAHFVVDKRPEGERTVTEVRRAEGEERVREVARMLSGDPAGAAALNHARQLLSEVAG